MDIDVLNWAYRIHIVIQYVYQCCYYVHKYDQC